jgi:diacylglycerol kinase
MQKFFASRLASFRYAFDGLGHVLITQPNAWIHMVISALVIVAGTWLQINRSDWLVVILTLGMVWASEIFNTAIEALVDLTSPQQHILARIAKDCSAGAVLVTSICAAIIGILIFLPPIWAKLFPAP